MSQLLDAAAGAPFIFVAGKGGVGKSTTAGALALASCDAGTPTRVISTDPAHSLNDLFLGERCSELLTIEELDSPARAAAWLSDTLGPVSRLVEQGTYLDADDVLAFSRLALPGVDELMAALRLGDLAHEAGGRVVVDTAPTGHTLRLLDADATFESLAGALAAMADKARAVASALTGGRSSVPGEEVIAALDESVRRFREDVLNRSAFIVVARAGAVVEAETERLLDALAARRLAVAARVWTGPPGRSERTMPEFSAPWRAPARGCAGLRAWNRAVAPVAPQARPPAPRAAPPAVVGSGASFAAWLRAQAPALLLFAGKGGVGKSTCAAAAALTLAADRAVLLCSADPAGSIADVLAGERAPRLRTLQIDPATELHRLRDEYQDDVGAALDRIGLSAAAALDRRVIESLWDLSPPGLDELAAMAAMLDAARSDETVVLDAAPTGHFLRMIEMPDVALAWTRQLMRVIVKYGIAGVAANAAESLLRLARELKALGERLRSADRTAAVIVTLPEPLVHAETDRLAAALHSAHIPVAATLVNRMTEPASTERGSGLRVHAPLVAEVRGIDALREFAATWKIVT